MIYRKLQAACGYNPGKSALVCQELKVSYRELVRKVDRRAELLLQSGLYSGARIGLFLGNSPEYVYFFYAIAKIGAVAVPIDPRSPSPELARIDSAVSFDALIFDQQRAKRVHGFQDYSGFTGCLINCECFQDEPLLEQYPGSSKDTAHADFIYFHGASLQGNHRTAIHTQKSLFHLCKNFMSAVQVRQDEDFLCANVLGGPLAIMLMIVPALLSGSTLHIPEVDKNSPRLLLEYIKATKIKIFTSVPDLFAAIVREEGDLAQFFTSVRFSCSAGAPVSEELSNSFFRKTGVRLNNLYGKVETGPTHINLFEEPGIPPNSVGKPIHNVSCKLVSTDGSTELEGENEGELYLRSNSHARGYLGNIQEEQQVFTADGWVRTGDIARRLRSGHYLITGRRSQFIIVEGNKVSPAELKQIVISCPGVDDALVVGLKQKEDDPSASIVCFVKCHPDCDLLSVKEYCNSNLVSYKQINTVVRVPSLSTLAYRNGQLDLETLRHVVVH